jgi:uncharacterized RDD family membrane protein YckC
MWPSDERPAGLFRRLGALVYDALLLCGIGFAATLAVLPFQGGEAFRPHDPLFSIYLIFVGFLFFGWFWTHGGQTLGMRAWKIRIRTLDDTPLPWPRALIRYLVALLSLALFGLGFLWVLIDSGQRAWHDRAAGTWMVRDRRLG